jgi:hypothetical protein
MGFRSISFAFVRDHKREDGAFSGDWFVDEGNSRSLRSAALRSG